MFTGPLTVATIIRTTDHYCSGPDQCTLIDVPFTVPFPCLSRKCLAKTSANTVLGGVVTPGKQGNVELQQLQIYQGGVLEFCEGIWLP